MIRRLQEIRRQDDTGAALVFVLIIVTVVALVTAALLSFSDTSVRTTVALRSQAATAYDADGAAQVAVNELKNDNFNNLSGQCLTSSTGLTLPNFYPGANGSAAASAYVSCTPGPNNGNGGGDPQAANTSPGTALLTLDPTSVTTEDGIYVNSNAGAIKVRGGIFSDSTINAPSGLVNSWTPPAGSTATTYNIARGACTGSVTVQYPQYGTTTCNYGSTPDYRGQDPGTLTPHGGSYDPPAPSVIPPAGTIGTCAGNPAYQTVNPGRFTSAAALNALTGCGKGIVWFKPGTYYFDFNDAGGSGNHLWNIDDIWVLAGTPSNSSFLSATPSTSTWPSACVGPSETGSSTTTGVEFVFGGDSQVEVTHQGSPGGQATICASNTSTATNGGPPIAVYGLKSAITDGLTHLTTWVNAQSGCVISLTSRCAVIYTDQSPNTTLTIRGTTYVPKAWIDINLNNNTTQIFRWGLIARSISIGSTGSPDLSTALVDVPNVAANPTPSPNIIYLSVYVCPAASSCSSSGPVQLRAAVQVSATTPRSVAVLSWSNQR